MTKTCHKCKKEKDIEEFCKNRNSKDGKNTICRKCGSRLSAEWRRKEGSKEKIKLNAKKWRAENQEKVKLLKKAYRDRNPERAREIVRKSLRKNREKYKPQEWRRALKRLYDLNPEDFYEIQRKQDNGCAICGRPERDSRNHKLCVDHCHKTNKVRGLLCFSCNVILGNANDNPEILRKAATYLENNQQNENRFYRNSGRNDRDPKTDSRILPRNFG